MSTIFSHYADRISFLYPKLCVIYRQKMCVSLLNHMHQKRKIMDQKKIASPGSSVGREREITDSIPDHGIPKSLKMILAA